VTVIDTTIIKPNPHVDERIDVHTNPDQFQNHLHWQRYRFTLERVLPDDEVLEIGTGLGVFSEMLLSKKMKKYQGIEFDREVCTNAQKRVGSNSLIQWGDAQSLAFEDQSFDCVICLEVLEHLPDFRKAVAEAFRVLRPSGRFIASVPYRRRGGPSKSNPYHLYEPGENELVLEIGKHFSKQEVYYQRFEETWFMTLARTLHIRRLTGLVKPYRNLHLGCKEQLDKIQLDSKKHGHLLGFIAVCTR